MGPDRFHHRRCNFPPRPQSEARKVQGRLTPEPGKGPVAAGVGCPTDAQTAALLFRFESSSTIVADHHVRRHPALLPGGPDLNRAIWLVRGEQMKVPSEVKQALSFGTG